MRPRPRRGAVGLILGVVAIATPVLSGCDAGGGASPEPAVAPARLPDDLCATMPERFVTTWNMSVVSHRSRTRSDEEATASCVMEGHRRGRPAHVVVQIASFGAEDRETARAVMDDRVRARCSDLRTSVPERWRTSPSKSGCQFSSPARPAERRGRTVSVSRAVAAYGLVEVRMRHPGLYWSGVAFEGTYLSGHYSLTPPDEL